MTSAETLKIDEAVAKLERSIAMCERRPIYQEAIDVCSASRAVWARFYNAWIQNTELKSRAAGYSDLFAQATEALQKTVLSSGPDTKQLRHLHLMIRNTKTRHEALNVIVAVEDRGEAVEMIEVIYNRIEVEKVDTTPAAAKR